MLQECFPNKELEYHRGWKYNINMSSEDKAVSELALDYDEGGKIKLWMYAGMHNNEARFFYSHFNEDKAKELIKKNYIISPEFQLASQRKWLLSLKTTKKDVFEYIRYYIQYKEPQNKEE